jgi:hypothetical protein
MAGSALASSAGPVGWWKLDETSGSVAGDSSGNGNHGANSNVTLGVPGAVGTAYGFNGTPSSNVAIAPSAVLLPGQLTLSVRINPASLSCGAACAVVANEGFAGSGEVGYGLRVFPTGQVQWCINATGGPGNCAYSALGLVSLNAWTNIVGTFDASTTIASVYVNGVFAAAAPTGVSVLNTTQPLYVGRLPDSQFAWNGSIDDLRIYDRVLSTAEIAAVSRPLPLTNDQCKNGQWAGFGVFRNQGDCVSFVATGGKSQPG